MQQEIVITSEDIEILEDIALELKQQPTPIIVRRQIKRLEKIISDAREQYEEEEHDPDEWDVSDVKYQEKKEKF